LQTAQLLRTPAGQAILNPLPQYFSKEFKKTGTRTSACSYHGAENDVEFKALNLRMNKGETPSLAPS
jgi:hypothetical protein